MRLKVEEKLDPWGDSEFERSTGVSFAEGIPARNIRGSNRIINEYGFSEHVDHFSNRCRGRLDYEEYYFPDRMEEEPEPSKPVNCGIPGKGFFAYKVLNGKEENKNIRACVADRKGMRSGLIIFQRENKGRLKAERAEYLFEFCGILVACVEDKSDFPDFERKEFNGVDFVLVPNKRLNRRFPAKEEMRDKVICYYEEDPFLELMNCIEQEEAEEILKIYQMIVENNLLPMIYTLRQENSKLFCTTMNSREEEFKWKKVIKNTYDFKLLKTLIDNAFPEENDFLSAYHMTFAKWYLKSMYDKIMKQFDYMAEYAREFRELDIKKANQPKAFRHLIAGEWFAQLIYYMNSKHVWINLGMTEYNPYIAAKFYRKIGDYELNNKALWATGGAGAAAEELHPMRADYVFMATMCFRLFSREDRYPERERTFKYGKDKLEKYLKIFQEDLLHLENFTFQELSYSIKIYSLIRQYYYVKEKREEIPYFPNFFDVVREYFYATIDQLPTIEQVMLESAVHWNGNMVILGFDWGEAE